MTTITEWHDSFAPLAAEWDALVDDSAGAPFLRPGWLAAWWGCFGQGRPAVLAARRGGSLVGVLPLQRGRGTLRSAANWHSTSSGLLAADADAARALAQSLFDTARRSITISFLDTAELGLPELAVAAERASYLAMRRVAERPPYASLDGGWDVYHASLGKNLRADVGRRLRRLQEAGDFALDLHDGVEGLDALLEEGFAVEASGWKGEQGTAIVSRPQTRAFYSEAARWAASRGLLQLAFLRLDGRPLAFHLNLVVGGVHYHVKGGYDPSYQQFSPGKVLHRLLLERACETGVTRYDFLGADEPYKLQWANGDRTLVTFQAFRSSPAGRIEHAAYAVGRPLAKKVLSLGERLRRDHS